MKRVAVALVVFLFAIAGAWADADSHGESAESVLKEIRSELNLTDGQRIDPERVPNALLERLGEAVMGEIHPDEKQHEWMDAMMGGEGSESLAAAHRWMGYRYLSGGFGPGSGMMGSGMMGPGMMNRGFGRWGMMGNPEVSRGDIPYSSPEQIVKRRYAEGEISREEYLRMMEDLSREE